MKIAFLHYHLNTGGVTTVIRQQVEALRKNHDVMVLTGIKPDPDFPVKTVTIRGIGYNRFLTHADTPEQTADAVIKALTDGFGGMCDILHVHNPLLAKNKNLLKILDQLQQKGFPLLLQIHDFAEDGRQQAYYDREAYPSNCHYAVINSRDYAFLKAAGLSEDGLHRIDNIIVPPDLDGDMGIHDNFILYPVRAIRRKNIGEAILLTCFFNEDEPLLITQPPNSPADMEIYSDWKIFVQSSKLNIEFEAGLRHSFPELVKRAKYIITTSISEGFGFSFLEPWMAEKGLWGRKLSDICIDFETHHLNLRHLYEGIRTPVNWIGYRALRDKWEACFKRAHVFYGQPVIESELKNRYDNMVENGHVDFGILDEEFQKKVISRILSDHRAKSVMIRLNPHLEKRGNNAGMSDLIRNNKNTVMKYYSRQHYAKRLVTIYKKISRGSVSQKIDKAVLCSKFLASAPFSLLKWGPYNG